MKQLAGLLFLICIIPASCVHAQFKQTKYFSRKINLLCSQSILLDSLGFFFREKGCEGYSTVSFGRYKIFKNNVLTLSFLPIDSLRPFRKIQRNSETADTNLTFTIYDRYEQVVCRVKNFEAIDKSNHHKDIETDEKGKIVLKRQLHRDLLIKPLLLIFGEQESLLIGNESAIDVHLDLPTMFLEHQEIRFEKPVDEQLILKDDGIYNSNKMQEYSINASFRACEN